MPTELEPCLALIHLQTDTGLASWYEVVYYDLIGERWKGYEGGTDFNKGEIVIDWKKCHDLIELR